MEPVIHLREAVALLGRFPALAGATLDVERGEIVLVRGPNGAGKSTLLRVCAGLVAVTSGEAVVLGHDLRSDRRAVRRQVGLLGHDNDLYDDLTVEENVRFWGRTAGARDGRDRHRPGQPRPGRARSPARPSARLSAGQRRRTAVAALVARRPELWLLDEPHAGLDAEGRDLLDDLVRQAVAAGATVVLASHELDRAEPWPTAPSPWPGGAWSSRVAGRARSSRRPAGRPPPPARVSRPPGPATDPSVGAVLRAAALVAGKDLRIEARSRVATNQVLPFALVVLLLFAFALDPDRGTLPGRHPGPATGWRSCSRWSWRVQRSFAIEAADGGPRRACGCPGSTRPGVFLGKAGALAAQLLVLEVALGVGVVLLYDADLRWRGCRCCWSRPWLVTTVGLAATGTLYRCPRRRGRGARDAAPAPAAPGGGAGADRCYESDRSGTRHRWRGHIGGLALGRSPRGVRPRLQRGRPAGLRAAPGGRHERPADRARARRASRVGTGTRARA